MNHRNIRTAIKKVFKPHAIINGKSLNTLHTYTHIQFLRIVCKKSIHSKQAKKALQLLRLQAAVLAVFPV